jgi:hypothetical protein
MRWFISAFAFAFSSMMAIADGLPSAVQRAIAGQRRECKTFALTFRQVQGRPAIVLGLAGDANPCRKDPGELCEVTESWVFSRPSKAQILRSFWTL